MYFCYYYIRRRVVTIYDSRTHALRRSSVSAATAATATTTTTDRHRHLRDLLIFDTNVLAILQPPPGGIFRECESRREHNIMGCIHNMVSKSERSTAAAWGVCMQYTTISHANRVQQRRGDLLRFPRQTVNFKQNTRMPYIVPTDIITIRYNIIYTYGVIRKRDNNWQAFFYNPRPFAHPPAPKYNIPTAESRHRTAEAVQSSF